WRVAGAQPVLARGRAESLALHRRRSRRRITEASMAEIASAELLLTLLQEVRGLRTDLAARGYFGPVQPDPARLLRAIHSAVQDDLVLNEVFPSTPDRYD